MKSGFFLNVVVGEGTAVLKLLSGENQSLLIWWDALLILNLRLDIVNGVRGLNFQSDGLASDWTVTSAMRSTVIRSQVYLRVLTKICMPPRSLNTK